MPWDLTGNSGTDPNNNFLGTTDDEPLVIRAGGAEALRVHPPTGGARARVGIGAADQPGAALEVVSDAVILDTLRLRNRNPVNPRSFRVGPGVGRGDVFGIHDDDANQTRLVIGYSGTVGIGTLAPNPNYLLHVRATANEPTGVSGSGVIAESNAGPALGAVSHTASFFAVVAQNTAVGGSGFRSTVSEAGPSGIGVFANGFTGVRGESRNGNGVLGLTHNAGDFGPNVGGTGVLGRDDGLRPGTGVLGSSDRGSGMVAFGNMQPNGNGDGLFASSVFGWCGRFVSSDTRSRGVFISVPPGQPALQVASGTKSAVAATSQGSRSLYSEEATEVWFTDYGFGQLEAGRAHITIDPLFAETVNLSEPYHVFVQLNDPDAEGAAVVNKTESTFEVVELRSGGSNAQFSYRLVGKRRHHETTRLEHTPWADDDPNLYPEKRSVWEAQQTLLLSATQLTDAPLAERPR